MCVGLRIDAPALVVYRADQAGAQLLGKDGILDHHIRLACQQQTQRVEVGRTNGRPAAVLISPDDLDSLEEALELLGDQTAIRDLVEAEAAVAVGDVVRRVDAVRALRPSSGR